MQVSGTASFPGAPLRVAFEQAPLGAYLACAVCHVDAPGQPWFVVERHAIFGDGQVDLETPYPHHDLVVGTYGVELRLFDPDGAVAARQDVGGYRVRHMRFSA